MKYSFPLTQDVDVDVVAVLNDTTGTLLAGSYDAKDCSVGLIMGQCSMEPGAGGMYGRMSMLGALT